MLKYLSLASVRCVKELRLDGCVVRFSYVLYESPDKQFGGLNESGQWTGMVGEVYRGVRDKPEIIVLYCIVLYCNV